MNEEERLTESNTQTAAGVLGFMGDLSIKQRVSKNTTYEAMALMEERHGLSEGVPADLLNGDQEIDVLLASCVMVAEIPSERFVKGDNDKFTYVPGQADGGLKEEVALPVMEMKEVVMIVSDGTQNCRNDAYTYASISRTSKVVNRRIVAMHARGTEEINENGKTVLSVCTGGALRTGSMLQVIAAETHDADGEKVWVDFSELSAAHSKMTECLEKGTMLRLFIAPLHPQLESGRIPAVC